MKRLTFSLALILSATAGLHAKLMPVMGDFIDGVQKAMAGQHLSCPAVVIGGNGRSLDAKRAVAEAGMTVASGHSPD